MKLMTFRLSTFSLDELNKILDLVEKTCNKIYLTQLTSNAEKTFLMRIKNYILESKKVTKWDGTILVPNIDEDGIISEDRKSIQHLIVCNSETMKIIRRHCNF
ncbi:MAG: hypothetical protein GX247_05780 [Mollicutes bacterium]|nr:hypothetical protein [Mollicutes bacterium]